jgi:hypothetical protein
VLGGVLSLCFSLLFLWFATFLLFSVFLVLDDLLELFFGFWPSSCTSCGIGFKIQTLCYCVVNVLIKGVVEKLSGSWFDL